MINHWLNPAKSNTPLSCNLEKAAQAWCEPTTQHLVMQPELAKVFASYLDEKDKEIHYLKVMMRMLEDAGIRMEFKL